MKESTQTLAFLGAAIVAVLVAYGSRPSDATYRVDDLIGKPLTKAFAPEEASSLKIIEFDEATATLREFEVAEEEGLWRIPSQGGYPADADEQMAKAATAVMDREVLAIAAQSAGDHADYGVVEPSAELEVGQTGVGSRVTLAKRDGTALVDLIVGKPVKDTEGQRYVRRANQDVVFVADIDAGSLSTDFEDWIEDDLLDLSPWDILRVEIQDYTAELVMRSFQPSIDWDRRGEYTLRYDDDESEWIAEELLAFDAEARDFQAFELGASEELNDDKLSDLKSALDDLRIVDVEKKPEGLSADLQAGADFLESQEAVGSLIRRGFAPIGKQDGSADILSSEGEVVCTLKDGVEYVLRFGNLQVSAADDEEGAEGDSEGAGDGVNRYLFVMARVNEDVLDRPEPEPLPELPPEADAALEEPADETTDNDEPSEGGASEGATSDDEPSDETDKGDDSADDSADEINELIARRKAIEDRNQQALADYQAELAAARGRVDELNARFGDWYYVIANDVYKKVRLGRDEIVQAREPSEDAPPADEPDEDASAFGAPGQAVPGLPDLPELGGDDPAAVEAPTADEQPAAEAADEATTPADAVEDAAAEAAADAVTPPAP